MPNAIPPNRGDDGGDDVANRIARQTLASRGSDYADEVRRLIDAGRESMRERGTTASPRVADIVTAAGLSNDAFYRHFGSKDALVAAILEDGSVRLRSYLVHQMDKVDEPDQKLRRWVVGIMAQAADEEIAATTLAVMWNAGSIVSNSPERPSAAVPLATLLPPVLAALGSTEPDLEATLIAHAVVGRLSDHLWARTQPTAAETSHLVAFAIAGATRQ